MECCVNSGKVANFLFFAFMISAPRKAKQFYTAVVKLLVVGAAFYFIYIKIAANSALNWVEFQNKFLGNCSIISISVLLLLSILNRYLEILKWQNLVSTIKPISISESAAHVLSGATAGVFTPNGVGDYASKLFYFDKSNSKKILLLNFLSNSAQMLVTVIFGIIGIIYFNNIVDIISSEKIFLILIVLTIFVMLIFLIRNVEVRNVSAQKLWNKIHLISKEVHLKNMLLSIARYLIFSHQFYFLLLIFNVDLPYLSLMSGILAMYFVSSSLPTFQILDFAVKGSVAVFFFGLLGVNDWIIIFTAAVMWLLNVVAPAVIGSYFIVKLKSQWK